MFVLGNRIAASNGLLCKLSTRLIKQSRTLRYMQGTWPEAITQQTLEQFLRDINYFREPKDLINIGLSVNRKSDFGPRDKKSGKEKLSPTVEVPESELDNLLGLLGEEAPLPPLDVDDTLVDPGQLANLALNHGIYRDLFDQIVPTSHDIAFTPEQAKRLDRLIPHYWITDLPHSRVSRKKEVQSLYYFEPVIDIFARFVHRQKDESASSHYAHTSYHGNVIPASEALVKPSITLDGRWLQEDPYSQQHTRPSRFNNWTSSNIMCRNFKSDSKELYYSVIMLNLDSLHPTASNLHWFLTNISPSTDVSSNYDELCEYLPVHGIKGFGHSRYVFLVLQHESKLNVEALKLEGFSLESRKFNAREFIENHRDKNMLPVGVSWFQTVWDESSNEIFRDYYKMKVPVYDMVQPKYLSNDIRNKAYPGRVPFNIFLDHCREKKDINKQVLLERLKTIDPYNYKDQYVPPKVPPTVFDDEPAPHWMVPVLLKKKMKVGYWRGLRPASATLPLNNNADLDDPLRPFISQKKVLPGFHNVYPGRPHLKFIKDLPYSKPINEHHSVYIQEGNEIHVDQVREMIKNIDKDESDKAEDGNKQ